MELDIRLQRDGRSPWGFRLIGGRELNLPLTIIEILPNSPAEKVGLQNGDAIVRIGEKSTKDLSLEEAIMLVDEAEDTMGFGIVRGLYDPVIDDQEPVLEEPVDFDRQQDPTEVSFKIQNFDDPSQGFGPHYVYDEDGRLVDPIYLGQPPVIDHGQAHYLYASPGPGSHDFSRGMSLEPYSDDIDVRGYLGFRESRSLTASPFSVSSKPYRPFSTEPLTEIPPVEDPIILNPEYKDDFGYKFEERGVESVLNLPKVEPTFKLPKSEKYDPNWEENNRNLEEKLARSIKVNKIMNERLRKSAERVLREINNVTSSEVISEEKKENIESELTCESKKINISSWELSEQFKREILEAKKKLKEEELNRKVEFEERIKQETYMKSFEFKQIKEEKEYRFQMKQEIDLHQIKKTPVNVVEESIAEEQIKVIRKDTHSQDMQNESQNKYNLQRKPTLEQNINEQTIPPKEIIESQKEIQEFKEEVSDNTEVSKEMQEELTSESKEVRTHQEYRETQQEANKIIKKNQPIRETVNESYNEEYKEIEETRRRSAATKMPPSKLNIENKTSKEEYNEQAYIESTKTESFDKQDKYIEFKKQNKINDREENSKYKYEENKLVEEEFIQTESDDKRRNSEQRMYTIGLQTIPNIRGVVHSQHYDLLLKTFFIHLTDVMVALSRFMLTQPVFSNTLSDSSSCRRETKETVTEEGMKQRVEYRKGSYIDNKVQTKEQYSNKREISKDFQKRKEQEHYIEHKLTDREIQKKNTAAKMSQKSDEITQKMDRVITEFQNKTEEVRRSRLSSSRSSIEEEVALEGDPIEWLDKINSRRPTQEFSELGKKEFSQAKSKQESKQIKTFKPKPGWQTYRAIVEAHVYTNPEVIFEDHTAEMLETICYETVESTNLATQCNQAIITENIAVENAVKQEMSTAKLQKGHTFSKAEIKNQATIESYEEMLHDVKNMEHINLKQTAVERNVENIKDIVIQETADVIEPVVNFKAEAKVVKQAKATKQEMLIQSAAEQTELNEVSQHEFTNVKEFKTEKAGISRDDFSAVEINQVDATKDEIIEFQVLKNQTAEAKKSLEVTDIRALEVSEVDVKSDEITELKIDKKQGAIAERTLNEVAAIHVTEVETEEDEIGSLKIKLPKSVSAETATAEVALPLEISEVKTLVDEISDLKIEKPKERTAKKAFEEAKSIVISETLVDKDEMSLLNIAKKKEAAVDTKLEEGNYAVQISEVSTEIDEIKDIQIRKRESEIAKLSYESTSALQISEVIPEIANQEIQELQIAKGKEFIAVSSVQEAAAVQVTEYKTEENEIAEFEVSKKQEVTALELTEESKAKAEINEVNVEIDLPIKTAEIETTKIKSEKIQDEFAELKIIKHQEIDSEYTGDLDSVEITEVTDVSVSNQFEGYSSNLMNKVEQSQYEVAEIQSEYDALNLAKQQILGISELKYDSSIDINQSSQIVEQIDIDNKVEIDNSLQISENKITEVDQSPERTPSPDLPTPLVDEYVFKLEIPLPKGITPVSPDPSPVEEKIVKLDEDPHIVKKKLVPHIDLSIESAIFDPPLLSPEVKVCSPIYRKPGLRGGSDRPEYRKEEIREIERKSSLLKSAIDQTIKDIEEYKEVEMEAKKAIISETSSKTESNSFSSTVEITTNTVPAKEANFQKNCDFTTANSLDLTEKPLLEIINSKEISKESKDVVPNGDLKDSINDVEKHVEDIKKIVQNTENIANITDTKTEATTESISTDNKITNNEIIELKPKINTEEVKSSSEVIVRHNKVEQNTESENEKAVPPKSEVLVETVKTSEITSVKVKEDLNAKLQENINEPNITVNSIDTKTVIEGKQEVDERKETSVLDLEVKEAFKEAEERLDPLLVVKPVEFHPENIRSSVSPRNVPVLEPQPTKEPYKTETGEIIGTTLGIVDGLEEAVVDEEVAKELGKPGLPDEKIAELISGEAEMLREAHVMGLSRVLSSHMHREDDSSVDFQKIKPLVESLKDSEVLKALNEELMRTREEKKKEERRWTTFLQKPARPVPKAKGGYPGYLHREVTDEEPYKVKIVKQPKPKVAPDYKPEDFDTGPLPWEEPSRVEESAPVNLVPEEPILIPEEAPEFLEAVDPLPESAVPDLEDTGIPLPPPPAEPEFPDQLLDEEVKAEEGQKVEEEPKLEVTEEKPQETMENNSIDNLVRTIHGMVDPNATLEQQLVQMRAQLAALAELPGVIQQTLELVTRQLFQMTNQQNLQANPQMQQVNNEYAEQSYEVLNAEEVNETSEMNGEAQEESNEPVIEQMLEIEQVQHELSQEEIERMKREEEEMIEEQRRTEKQKKELLQAKLEQESRQLKQRPTPRVGKPKPVFGPLNPERPLVLPGGRRWRGPRDAYNEELIKETLTAQAELIQGRVLGFKYESDKLPYDERVNFMKYEKPPVSLDHLKNSEVYKLVHDMDETPVKRVELLTPVIAEADYRERCRSRTPNIIKSHNVPQQLMP